MAPMCTPPTRLLTVCVNVGKTYKVSVLQQCK